MTTPPLRFKEFDIIRALPLLIIPLVHTYEEMSLLDALPDAVLDGCSWVMVLCVLAPVFMLCLGTNLAFSRHTSAEDLLRRGLQLLCWGLLLNLVRFIFPAALTSLFLHSPALLFDSLYYTITPDIYDFAGLAFLAFALFRRLNLSPLQILLLSFLTLTLDAVIPNFQTSNLYFNAFIGRFLWMDFDSCFPLLTWLVYPAVGYCFGLAFLKQKDRTERDRLMKRVLWVSATGLAAMWFSLRSYGLDPLLIMISPENESVTDLPGVLSLLFFAGILFSLVYVFFHRFRHTRFCRGLVDVSFSIIPFYVSQWIIIGWSEYVVYLMMLKSDGPVFTSASFWLYSLGALDFSLAIAHFYTAYRKKHKRRQLFARGAD